MDYNAPVARRTRLSEEKYWRELCEKQAGKRKLRDGSDKKEKSRKESKKWNWVSLDDSEENEEVSVRKEKKKGGKRKLHDGSDKKEKSRKGSKELDFVSVDDFEESEENEEAGVSPSTGGKEKKKGGKRKLHDGSNKKEKSRKGSMEWDCVSEDDSEENEEASVSPSVGGKDKKKSGKRKLHAGSDMKGKSRKGSKEWDCIYVDDSEENEEVSVSPSTKGKNKKKGGKRKSAEGSKKQRSGCDDSDDGGAASVEILSESSFGKQDNDSVGFDHVESAGSNGKNSKSGTVDIKNLCPVDVEDSDDEVVYLGEEKVEGFGCSSTEGSDASEDTASDDSDESWKSSSSEDAISDASDDESFEQEKSESSVFSEESNSCSGEGHDDEREVTKTSGKPRKGKSVEGDVEVKKEKDIDPSEITKGSGKAGKGRNVEVGVRRKRRVGLDMSVDADDDIDSNKDDPIHSAQEFNSVAKQNSSRVSRRSEKKRIESGTVNQRLCVDEDNEDSSSGHDNDNEDVDETNCSGPRTRCHEKKTGSDDDRRNDESDKTYGGSPETEEPSKWNGVHGVCNKNKGDIENLTNRSSMRAKKDCNAFKILVDSIYEKGEGTLEGSVSFGYEGPKDERNPPESEMTTLPLKFTFPWEQSNVPKKSECDPEEKELWEDLEFALRVSEIGSPDSNVVESQDSLPIANEVETVASLCRRGVHQLILDEEIGLRCKFCSYLDQEIKYILPDFIDSPYGRFGTRGSKTDNRSIFDELQSHVSDSDRHSGCNSHPHVEGTVWDLIPGVKSSMYPHQREGFEFIWNHIAGGIHLDKLKKPSSVGGNGCIISHAPGTGKTRLTIVFLQTYMELFPDCRPLLIAPRSMLLTWEEEFKKWKFDIPFHNLNNLELSGEENQTAVNLVMQAQGRKSVNKENRRMLKLYSWKKNRSILGITYRLFEQLCGAQKTGSADEMGKILLEFPGLVVFDEGHTPRNDQSHMWKALSEIKTKRRILLSGTPFQNNFQELFNTICLVRPTFAASIDSTKFGRDLPRKRGRKSNGEKLKWTFVASSSGKVADDKEKHATEVKAQIAPFVHVYKGSVLQDSLPGLRNSVVVLHPTPLQVRFHKRIQGVKEPFRYENLEALICIHPSLLLKDKEDAFSADRGRLEELKLNPDAGVKAKFVMELIRLSNAMKERVLVFSQYLDPLILLRDLLNSLLQWTEGEEVLYMDGRCDMKQRQSSMKVFNDPSSNAKVLLASTKACSEGISLVGASRVVLLDVAWNPSVERQAISRAYRLGQKKVVFVYHLLMDGTNEEDKYSRQVDKSRLSELVFSDSDKKALEKEIRATVSEDKILEEMAQHEKLKHIFKSIALLHEDIYFEQLGQSTFG
ncbi:hypothetical protein ACE6H2_016727 [Prunus campanulata]